MNVGIFELGDTVDVNVGILDDGFVEGDKVGCALGLEGETEDG